MLLMSLQNSIHIWRTPFFARMGSKSSRVKFSRNFSVTQTFIFQGLNKFTEIWLLFCISIWILFWQKIVKSSRDRETQVNICIFEWDNWTVLTYSTVDKSGCTDARLNTDFFFCFTITQRTPHLNVPLYSEYQFFLYETITEQRKEGKTFDQTAD